MFGDALRGSFGGAPNSSGIGDVELLSVSLAQLTLEEKAKVWWAIQQPLHVSLISEVRVVQVNPFDDAERIIGGSVKQRRLESAVPVGAQR